MTLATYVRLLSPKVTPRAVFDHARALLGATEDFTWQHTRGRYDMDLLQGLPALMDVRYGVDGPSPEHRDYCEPEDRAAGECVCGPQYAVQIRWDTAYGYGGGTVTASDLHAYLVEMTGRWLDEQGVPWVWMTDTYGDWNAGWTNMSQLGNPAHGAPVLPVERNLTTAELIALSLGAAQDTQANAATTQSQPLPSRQESIHG